jgi:Sulfotransferase domain
MAVPLKYQDRLARKLPRVVKFSKQWLRSLGREQPDTRFVFIVGAQRSGTRLPLQVIDHAPEIATFSEGAEPFFDDVLLRPLDELESLARRSPAPIIALKPICETHRVHELLDRFPASRAIWIFRNYEDTAQSATAKWKSGKDALRSIARREISATDWRVGGMTDERWRLVASLYRDDLSQFEANAVMWLIRNSLYFDLKANERREILLVRYEDLIGEPQEQFDRLFGFIGVPVPPSAMATIRPSRGSKKAFPAISPDIKAMCEKLQERLVAHYNGSKVRSFQQ